jgi:Ca2+:H+ antiporter
MSTHHAATPTTELAAGEDTSEGDSSDDEPPTQHLTDPCPSHEGPVREHASLFARLNLCGKYQTLAVTNRKLIPMTAFPRLRLRPVAQTYDAVPGSPSEAVRAPPKPRDHLHSKIATLRAIALSSWANLLLVFLPAGIATGICKVPPIVTFICNAVAIIPLSSLLAYATECIATDLGDTVGALLNISFGNIIEVIMFVIALIHNHIRVVQGALVGSMLVNLLLILGSAVIVGEFQPLEMVYDMANAQALACLLSLSVFSILIPSSLHYTMVDEQERDSAVLTLSRASALTLLVVYGVYLTFLLRPRPRYGILSDTESQYPRPTSLDVPIADTATVSRLSRTIRFADEHHSERNSLRSKSSDSIALEPMNEARSEHSPPLHELLDESASDADNQHLRQMTDRLRKAKSRPHPPAYSRSPSNSRSRSRSLNSTRRFRYRDIAERYGSVASDDLTTPTLDVTTNVGVHANSAHGPVISRPAAVVLLICSSLLVALCADVSLPNVPHVSLLKGVACLWSMADVDISSLSPQYRL